MCGEGGGVGLIRVREVRKVGVGGGGVGEY